MCISGKAISLSKGSEVRTCRAGVGTSGRQSHHIWGVDLLLKQGQLCNSWQNGVLKEKETAGKTSGPRAGHLRHGLSHAIDLFSDLGQVFHRLSASVSPLALCLQKWRLPSSGDFQEAWLGSGILSQLWSPPFLVLSREPLIHANPKPTHLGLISCLPWGLIGVSARAEFLHSN